MTTGSVTVTAADGVAAPLDLLLTDVTLGPLRRFNPGGAGLRLAAALAARPGLVAGRSRQLLGELSRVAAGTSAAAPSRRDRRFTGHIAAMVNPPGNEKASYQAGGDCAADAQEWLRHAESRRGSWWPDYAAWLAERCGPEKDAPAEPGGAGLTALCAAPGTYVYDR